MILADVAGNANVRRIQERSMNEKKGIVALRNRLLQQAAMSIPGGGTLRVYLHRLRGVRIGAAVWIGYQVLIETACPDMVRIGDRVVVGIRTTILAHFQDLFGVNIMNDVYIGPASLILPGVTIGEGAVVSAGSVVTASVAPRTLVQGNPAKPIAICGIPLGVHTSRLDFLRHLKRIGERGSGSSGNASRRGDQLAHP
jgi:hypothetical protein